MARRSEAEPPEEEGLEGVIEVLAKAPVLLRADARAEYRSEGGNRKLREREDVAKEGAGRTFGHSSEVFGR